MPKTRLAFTPALGVVAACLIAGTRLGAAKPPAVRTDPAAAPVARFSYADRGVEIKAPGGPWEPVSEGTAIRTGDRLRTGRDAAARFDFPWMTVALGPSTAFSMLPGPILATSLESGRAEIDAQGDIIKLITPEARVMGGGHAVVGRDGGTTRVMALAGQFRVDAAGKRQTLEEGEGVVVASGKPAPEPRPLPPSPRIVSPGEDPMYVPRGHPVRLAWESAGARSRIEVLAIDTPVVLFQRTVGVAPYALDLPWTGTFRWRVAAIDAAGLESRPSANGVFCIVN
jgi:hypothetical protein